MMTRESHCLPVYLAINFLHEPVAFQLLQKPVAGHNVSYRSCRVFDPLRPVDRRRLASLSVKDTRRRHHVGLRLPARTRTRPIRRRSAPPLRAQRSVRGVQKKNALRQPGEILSLQRRRYRGGEESKRKLTLRITLAVSKHTYGTRPCRNC